MKNDRRIVAFIAYIVIGAVLFVLGLLERVDSFWSGMGSALIAVGAIRMVYYFRSRNNEAYRAKQEVEINDERNRFIRNKAWAWAGYLFVMVAAILTIVFKLMGQDLLYTAAGFSICIIITLYWVCYLILKKKY